MDTQPPLTTTQAGKILGVTRPTVLKLIRSGQLQAVRICTSTRPYFKIRRADLDAFMARNTTTGPTPPIKQAWATKAVKPARAPAPRSKFELLVRRSE